MTNCWIFQVNPKNYDLLGYLKSSTFVEKGQRMFFTVREHQDKIRYGDLVFIYKGGTQGAGIYAIGTVAADLVTMKDPLELDGSYWVGGANKEERRVLLIIEDFRVDQPFVSLKDLQRMGLPAGTQGTVRRLDPDQCRKLLDALSRQAPP